MALKKPLVLNTSGIVEQLQSGDTLDATINVADEVTLTNANASTAAPGSPVYISAANSFDLSRANSSGTAKVIGLLTASTAAAASGVVRKDGTITLTTGQWDTIAGTTGGLTAGANYYLSEATAGRLTATAPTTGFVLKVGVAISTTDFEIQISEPIKL
jgi:hypothetical protein